MIMGRGGRKNKNAKRDKDAKKRGSLDEQTLGYYRRISEMLKQDFQSEDEKLLFLGNVLRQLATEVLQVSQNQTTSRIVELLVHEANRQQLTDLMQPLSRNWETACCDRFASYVTQSLVLHSSQFLGQCESSGESTSSELLEELFDSLCQFLLSSITLYMQHIYASHVLRVVFEVLSGRLLSDSIIRSRVSLQQQQTKGRSERQVKLQSPSDIYRLKLYEFCHRIISVKKLEDHVQHNLANPVLQSLLLSLKSLSSDQLRSLCHQFETNSKLLPAHQTIPENVVHEVASHLVEQYLAVIPADLFEVVWHQHFSGHLVEMSSLPVAYFVVRQLISTAPTKELFEQIFDELIGSFEQILALNHFVVILRLGEACVRHGTRQKEFIKCIQKAFHCYKPRSRRLKLVPLLASFTTYEVFYKLPETEKQADDVEQSQTDHEMETEVDSFNYYGSMLVQSMLHFNRPQRVVDSLLELSKKELMSVCCHPSGSHVIDAFLRSSTVLNESHKRLYKCLKHAFFTLACDKCGSRTFDTLWDIADVQQRKHIAGELSHHADALRANTYGSFIHRRCALQLFVSRPKDWEEAQCGQTRKRKVLQQLADDVAGHTTVKRGKRAKTEC